MVDLGHGNDIAGVRYRDRRVPKDVAVRNVTRTSDHVLAVVVHAPETAVIC